MKLTIKLLSDSCTCSGETYNSKVDMDVVYDENGLPYIPAKRIKGCIREAALEMMEFGLIEREKYEKIFGKEGNHRSAFSLSNAYIENYDQIVATLKAYKDNELVCQQKVLNEYTSIRTQTAVDLETGVADENSLRTIRVVNKGLVFEADCEMNESAETVELLKQAVSLVKHIGVSRTRGLGLVEMRLTDCTKEAVKHVQISPSELSEKNRIGYKIHLKSALICKSAKGNQADTEDYIAGSKVLGMIAGQLGKEKYKELMSSGELVVSNAYISNGEERGLPGRISLQKKKDTVYENGILQTRDMMYVVEEPEPQKKNKKSEQMTPANIDYITKDGMVADVVTEISYHHQRPKDKSIGRATANNDSSFYQLASISVGQSFRGYIYADQKQTEILISAMEQIGNIRMGYGKNSEFGAIEFVLDELSAVTSEKQIMHDAMVTLVSDLILYNENGVLTTEIGVMKEYLESLLDVKDLEIINPFLQFTTIGGFNVTWNRRKPIFNALGKGSTFLLHSETGFDAGLLSGEFLGERVTEGYGEILVEEPLKKAEVEIKKNSWEKVIEEDAKADRAGIMQLLLQSEFERRVQSEVRRKLNEKKSKYETRRKALNPAISKIRLIFKTELTYEAMLDQIKGIESEEKNGLCTELTALIVPEQIKVEITEKMEQDYHIKFNNSLNYEELYRHVYRAYITELKQFVRTLEKEDDTK